LRSSAFHQNGEIFNVYNHFILFRLAILNVCQLPFIG